MSTSAALAASTRGRSRARAAVAVPASEMPRTTDDASRAVRNDRAEVLASTDMSAVSPTIEIRSAMVSQITAPLHRRLSLTTGVNDVGSSRLGRLFGGRARDRSRRQEEPMTRRVFVLFGVWMVAWALCLAPAAAGGPAQEEEAATEPSPFAAHETLLQRYCLTCHNERLAARGTVPVALRTADLADVPGTADVWEKVIRKLRTGSMPPVGRPRPEATDSDALAAWLEREIDRVAAAHPNPGRTEPLHRLNRTEYQNAVRDLLALDIDAAALVPADDQSYGFDNIAGVLKVSPTLLERYMNAARTVSRLAVGASPMAPAGETFRIISDLSQYQHRDGPAVRDARRHVGRVQLSPRRRVRAGAGAARPLCRRADPRAAPARAEFGRRAGRHLPPDSARPRPGSGLGLQLRSGFASRPACRSGPARGW